MAQLLLIASLFFNVGFGIHVMQQKENHYFKCDAYEDFLEEWYKYNHEREELESEDDEYPEFDYEIPLDEDEEEMPSEEVKWLRGKAPPLHPQT